MTYLPPTTSTPARSHAGGALLQLVRPAGPPLPPLAPPVWREILTLARREQVAPLLFRAVEEERAASVPEVVRAELADTYRQAASCAETACRQLTDLTQALRTAGVSCVVLKGAGLALFTYPDRALRPFTDLDVLVREQDRCEADRTLRRLGYVARWGADPAAQGEQDYYDPSWRRLPIDVHWRYDAYPHHLGIDYTGVFARAQAADHHPIFCLSPADMVVALSAHLLKHLWGGDSKLRYLRDITEVARRHPVEWHRVVQAACDAPRMRSPLRLSLMAAAALLGAPVPPAVVDALRPRRGAGVEHQLLARLEARILQPDPLRAALLQVAAMRWLDGEAPSGYARLVMSVFYAEAARALAFLRRRAVRLRRGPPRA